MEREYQFHPKRKWKFDFAYPLARVAVEIDGGQWAERGGRHSRDTDREKLNAAARMGWLVFRFSPEMLETDPAYCIRQVVETIEDVLLERSLQR